MDLRKWFLLNDPPASQDLESVTKHIPCSMHRSRSVLRLFASGYRTAFALTDGEGQPTESLRLMVSMMKNVELCQLGGLLPEERKGFGLDGPELINLFSTVWYLRGLTERIRCANTAIGYGQRDWVWHFLPGLDGGKVTYLDPDGRKRKRVCYLATCRPDWKMDDALYEGLWKFTDEHHENMGAYGRVRPPDGYGILERDPTIGLEAGQRSAGHHAQGSRSFEATVLQAAVGCS